MSFRSKADLAQTGQPPSDRAASDRAPVDPGQILPPVIAQGGRTRGMMDRRGTLKALLAAGVSAAALLGAPAPAAADPVISFDYGVASGDPLANAVVIWTALTSSQPAPVYVFWAISRSPDMSAPFNGGLVRTSSDSDYTVKIDVTGLDPDTTYYYQFSYRSAKSPVGRTRTLPVGAVANVRLAAFSCTNYPKGYFNVYREAAKISDLNAVLFLGDFIYEYGQTGYVTPAVALGLVPQPRLSLLQPTTDILQLNDYRLRYRLYFSDPDLRSLLQINPAIVVWDDHEFANDGYMFGADNHNPATQGPWSERKKRAIQAFYEYIPIREPAGGQRFDANGVPTPIYRSFDFGNLARLAMLDTRIIGRDAQFATAADIASPQLYQVYGAATADGRFPADLNASGAPRQLMGTVQEAWLQQQLAGSPQTWQLIGNQVLYFYQGSPDFQNSAVLSATERAQLSGLLDQLFGAGSGTQFAQLGAAGAPIPTSQDSWTGYPSAKQRMAQILAQARNPVILTGDSHNAWAANLGLPTATGIAPLGVEFGASSVTSPGFEQYLVTLAPEKTAALYLDTSTRKSPVDKLVYTDQSRRGFMLLDVTPQRVRADFRFVDTVFQPTYVATTGRVLQVQAGQKKLSEIV